MSLEALQEKAAAQKPGAQRVYVACLASYKVGRLHGVWLNVSTPEKMLEETQAMLADSSEPDAEEWLLHSFQGFQGIFLSEFDSFDTVCDVAEFLQKYGELGAAVLDYFGNDLVDARRAFENYAGEYASTADFAEEFNREIGKAVPERLQDYIDWEKLARDMVVGGEIFVIQPRDDEVHVFWGR